MNDVIYTKKVSGEFNEVVSLMSSKIEENQFTVLHVHDVQAMFKAKGFERSPYKILEFCRAPVAVKVLEAHPEVGILLPCKVVV